MEGLRIYITDYKKVNILLNGVICSIQIVYELCSRTGANRKMYNDQWTEK